MKTSISGMLVDGVKRRVQGWAYGKASSNLSDPRFRKVFGIDGAEGEELIDPFKQLPVVRAAITAKASNIAQVPFIIAPRGNRDNPIESGPVIELFQDVNPYSSNYDLWELIVTYMDGWGDAPIFLDTEHERAPGIPRFLWPEHPTKVRPAKRNDRFIGWLLKTGTDETFYLPEEVIFPKYSHPDSKIRGLSKLSALSITNKGDWGAIKHNQVFFDNDVSAGIVFYTPEGVNLDNEDYARIQQELITSKKGVGNAHKALILQGGLKAEDMRKNNKDMQFIEMRKFNREDVAMVEGVPKAELQLYEDINYATAQTADRSFWKKTLIPLMRKISDSFNTGFFHSRQMECFFDVTRIDVLNDEILEKAATAQTYVNVGYTINQVNERLNLGFPPVPWGDQPKGFFEVPDEPAGESLRDVTPEPKELGNVMSEIHRKKWIDITQKIQPEVSRTSRDVRAYFKKIEKKILKEFIKRPSDGSVHIKVSEDFGWIEALFEDSELLRIIEFHSRKAAELGIVTIVTSELVQPEAIIHNVLSAHGGAKITGINKNAAEYVISTVQRTLSEAIDLGITEAETAEALAQALKGSLKNVTNRARTIARTEIHGAYSQARHETIEQTNPVRTRWISTHDDVVRETHEDMDGESKADTQGTYSNGLRYPLDPQGEAGEVINCRCVEVPEYDEE